MSSGASLLPRVSGSAPARRVLVTKCDTQYSEWLARALTACRLPSRSREWPRETIMNQASFSVRLFAPALLVSVWLPASARPERSWFAVDDEAPAALARAGSGGEAPDGPASISGPLQA